MHQCRHKFTLCAPYFAWRYCSLCFVLPLPLKDQVYHCAMCGRVLHSGCLDEFLKLSDNHAHHKNVFGSALKEDAEKESSKRSAKLWTSFREFVRHQDFALRAALPLGDGASRSWPFSSFSSDGEKTSVPHRHRMVPTRFYYPTTCSQCLSANESEKKDSGDAAQSNRVIPRSTTLGFGSCGYRCAICHYALHAECFRALDPAMYETAKEHVPDAEDTTRMNNTGESGGEKGALSTDTDGIPSAVRFIASLVFDAKDPNTMLILRDFIALLQRFSNRHPSIGIKSLNPYNMMSICRRDKELYRQVCDSLRDADFMFSEGPEGPTMQLLRKMMRFATAVYGQAYKSGFLSSVAGGVASRSIRRDILYTDDVTNNQAVMDILALPKASLILSRWSQNALEPNYCIIVDQEARHIILSFRGTLSDGDLLSDVCAYGFPFAGGHAHQGAARIVAAMFDHRTSSAPLRMQSAEAEREKKETQTESENGTTVLHSPRTTDDGIDVILSLTEIYPDFDICVTGHSLGAGVALLFGVRAIQECVFGERATQRMRVFAFGPMPVLTLPAAQSYETQLWSVVNGNDVVCRLQLNAIDRLAAEISREKTPTSNDTADLTEEMHHPGRVFMLTSPLRRETNRVVEVPRGHISMHHVFTSSGMLKVHFMDAYAASLREVHLRTP